MDKFHFAAALGAPHLDGSTMSLLWSIPFVGILLSIAIFPLVLPQFWHRHFGKVAAFWAFSFLIPFALIYGYELTLYELLHVTLLEYFPFIILLLALFTVAGGVRLTGYLPGTPLANTGILALGTILASWMGTTGAAMLLIRPIIKANEQRVNKTHIIVFFIFLVANIGGALTPLGDPPLFLGFLKGIDFFWTAKHMLFPMIILSVVLLVIFYVLDSFLYAREDKSKWVVEDTDHRLGIEGGKNLILLLGVIGAVLLSGIWKPGIYFDIYHVPVALQNIVRDILLLSLTGLSLILTSKESRMANGFTWFPIVEVGKLFIAIFITIVPVISILKAGADGQLAFIINSVSENGQPLNGAYFWLTGILSSFLDNAPTYVVFFNVAGGHAAELMGPLENTLLAISCGAVFMGAVTYIGNAPNFMVRAIAEDRGIAMPSFFGYMIWSVGILFPLFLGITFIFF